eukprot:CAMPEP_0178379454 /NCGR_PEP_ID=MMETSP0689_2-20121128/4951_1 /TAXON_ID=160604 /ORGANISM="Amphidinium massartii, Strain CS-259" /LENGTH=509 /DNA_ID=CAMNT_0019999557 /DNA_START=72 /DNA_END=1601 /DNA_ORIENTATION=+
MPWRGRSPTPGGGTSSVEEPTGQAVPPLPPKADSYDATSLARPWMLHGHFSEDKATVIVIGGGFAGLHACRTMRRDFNVILIDAKEYFEFYPGILRAYVHPMEHAKLYALYQHICDLMGVRFVWGEATGVDGMERKVQVRCMAGSRLQVFDFDYLIIACGSQYGLYMSSTLRPASAAECLWYPTFLEKVIQTESAWGHKLDERFLSGRRAHFEHELQVLKQISGARGTIVIVGAGFVGIEWATEVKYYFPDIEVIVVESRDECVGVMPPRCRRYCQRYMERVGIKTIYNFNYHSILQTGSERMEVDPGDLQKLGIEGASRIYMAVGVRSINQFLPECCLEDCKYDPGTGAVTRGGFINCNKQMQVMHQGEDGQAEPFGGGRIYAAGNCCSVAGMRLPKNSCPGEDMATVACHNIKATEKLRNSSYGGCFRFLKPNRTKEIHWGFGTSCCATSLGPDDATIVAFSSSTPGSGFTVCTGLFAAYQKEFIRWSKVDQCRMGCLGGLVWSLMH